MTLTTTQNYYDTMAERGLVAQCTDSPERIRARLSRPTTAYCGFDPTADSLHVGSLVPIMGLAHLQRAGHRPVVLVGGATGMIGDPSFKSEARNMMGLETVRQNVEALGQQIGRFIRFGDGPGDAVLVNNLDWIEPLSWMQVLREIGSKVSVNRMVRMESVKQRMAGEGEGISYLEFSYMLLQAYDFAHLHEELGCVLQLGGQDQWGNIVMGIELGRKLHDADLAGLTFPLVTKSDGGKFGKSESGNVWLDAERTPPFEFFQFWRNVADGDVGRYLGYFTFLPMEEVSALAVAEGMAINESKARLAYEVTKLVHGEEEAARARDAAAGAFGALADMTGDAIPHQAIEQHTLFATPVLVLLRTAGFTKSNGEGRKLIANGGVRVGDRKLTPEQTHLAAADVSEGHVLLRAGKKRLFRFDVR
ncbi:MAG: tyrosine--tRNA ligase [Planctomycetota bacterium]